MAVVEDAASVLEQFVQDGIYLYSGPYTCTTAHVTPVANLPAEIAHLLEEIEAKDRVIQECRNVINIRDTSIQKYLKLNGAGQTNPKEDAYSKSILTNFEKAMAIQNEKVTLSEKSGLLVSSGLAFLEQGAASSLR